jgi:hypothetical protein
MQKITRRGFLAGSTALFSLPVEAKTAERWPAINIKPEWVKELNERLAGTSGIFHDNSYKGYLIDYSAAGNYLNWGAWREFSADNETFMTEDGLPKVKDPAYPEPYWNPATLSHYALTHHGRMVLGKSGDAQTLFLKAADKLIELQLPNGGFPYPPLPHREFKLPNGWISGMAQGNAMSVFYRAWLTTKDRRYLKAGSLAYACLMTPIRKGGAATSLADLNRSLSSYPFLAEYPTTPVDYTLNGYMFALLGLYDWSHLSKSAGVAFKQNMKTLERLLSYYDIDGFSIYDLSHIVMKLDPAISASYFGVHVYLLHALHHVTGRATLKKYERRWATKIDKMNRELRITSMPSDRPSPQPANSTITFEIKTAGGEGGAKLYQFAIKRGTEWTMPQPFSPSPTFSWKPTEPDDYIIGFYVKEAGSLREFDNYRYQRFTIN